jgi:hypothetical protein
MASGVMATVANENGVIRRRGNIYERRSINGMAAANEEMLARKRNIESLKPINVSVSGGCRHRKKWHQQLSINAKGVMAAINREKRKCNGENIIRNVKASNR